MDLNSYDLFTILPGVHPQADDPGLMAVIPPGSPSKQASDRLSPRTMRVRKCHSPYPGNSRNEARGRSEKCGVQARGRAPPGNQGLREAPGFPQQPGALLGPSHRLAGTRRMPRPQTLRNPGVRHAGVPLHQAPHHQRLPIQPTAPSLLVFTSAIKIDNLPSLPHQPFRLVVGTGSRPGGAPLPAPPTPHFTDPFYFSWTPTFVFRDPF